MACAECHFSATLLVQAGQWVNSVPLPWLIWGHRMNIGHIQHDDRDYRELLRALDLRFKLILYVKTDVEIQAMSMSGCILGIFPFHRKCKNRSGTNHDINVVKVHKKWKLRGGKDIQLLKTLNVRVWNN